jgi:hypothetical protein
VYRNVVGKPEERDRFGDSDVWEDDIKLDLKEMRLEICIRVLCGLGQGLLAGSCGFRSEFSGVS